MATCRPGAGEGGAALTDWYDEQKRRERRAKEKLGLPEFDSAPVADYAEAPSDQAARYLLAMGETRAHDDGTATGTVTRWTCGCTTSCFVRAEQKIRETILRACAKHDGKVA